MLEQSGLKNKKANELEWIKKENTLYFEEKQCTWKDLWKSDTNVEKPSQARVRVLRCIVRVSNSIL